MNIFNLKHLKFSLRSLESRAVAAAERPAPPIPREVEIDSSIRARIRAAMAQAGLQPRDLAHTQSITAEAIEEVLDGRRSTISDGAVRRIAQRLGTYPGLLLYGRLTTAERMGQRIRGLREARGLQQAPLAMELGISEKTIERWEIGQTTPTRENLLAIARYFGVSSTFVERGETPRARFARAAAAHRGWITAVTIVAAAAAVVVAVRPWEAAVTIPLSTDLEVHVTGDARVIEVRDTRSGDLQWSQSYPTLVDARRLTWNDEEVLLVRLSIEYRALDTPAFEVRAVRDGGLLVADGSVLDTRDETRRMRGAFMSNVAYRATSVGHVPRFWDFGDLDGDGQDEIFVLLEAATENGPGHLGAYTRDGRRVLEYCFSGSVHDYLVDDLDQDGRDEVVVAGSVASPTRLGPALVALDDTHAKGALCDDPAVARGDNAPGALAIAEWPAFDARFMELLHGQRVVMTEVRSRRDPATGVLVITATVGVSPDAPALVFLDEGLCVTSIAASDILRGVASQWPDGLGEAFLSHLSGWAARSVHAGVSRIGTPATRGAPRQVASGDAPLGATQSVPGAYTEKAADAP